MTTMTYEQQATQAQTAPPAPPAGQTPPPIGAGGTLVPAQVEAAFIGGLLKTVVEKAVPFLLDTLREQVSSTPAAAGGNTAAVQRVYEDTGVAFWGFIGPVLEVLAPVAIKAIGEAVSSQSAQGAGIQGVPTQQTESSPAGVSYVR
jgi:hypothetical protein